MKSVILSVMLLAALVVADQQCGDNLVQALRQCAASISANEDISVQQERCSPNGCNYDCTSANALDSLNQQVASMNATITYLLSHVAKAGAQFDTIDQSITSISTAVDANLKKLSAAIGGTATNLSLALTSVTQDVGTNEEDIRELSRKIEEYHGYCGSNDWRLAAYLNMSDLATNCPDAFSLYVSGDIRACRRQSSLEGSCDSLVVPVDVPYSEVCGRFRGYVFGTPDAIHQEPNDDAHNDINSYYADGVSLTYGSPRIHIWTFMAGFLDEGTFTNRCPCNPNSEAIVQSFVGDDYYCESGNDVLWDGECSQGEITCCQPSNLPYFHRVLGDETTSNLEIRICGDQDTLGEDVPVSFYEIYVK